MHVDFADFYLKKDVMAQTMTVTVSSTRLINVRTTRYALLEAVLCPVSRVNVNAQDKCALKAGAYPIAPPSTVPLAVNAVMVNAGIRVARLHANRERFVRAVFA